jgi:glutamate formiminotransferase/glutamate formiminotransferase/formiminotetrahydrofolate cyclodeaminase
VRLAAIVAGWLGRRPRHRVAAAHSLRASAQEHRRSGRTASLHAVERPTLLAVPNVSEGRARAALVQIAAAFAGDTEREGGEGGGVRLLDAHRDPDHHRSVFTLAGQPEALGDALVRGASAAVERVDVVARASAGEELQGQHPHVGAVDVVPIVYLRGEDRGAACAEALVVADRIGRELGVPVFLYGELTEDGSARGRTRAELRRGGVAGLERRLSEPGAALAPDFGPPAIHPSAGAALVAARPPLVAFNLLLEPPASIIAAREIAALIREGGAAGLPGVRAIGVLVDGARAQVSMNVERPDEMPLADVVAAVRRLAAVSSAELVGLAPAAALEGFPEDLPLAGFDPARHIIENALGC